MNRKRLLAVFAIAVAAVGLALGVRMPVSNADVLGNGYDVECHPANATEFTCSISGCPRVHEDLAGDRINTRLDNGGQSELEKSCGNTAVDTIAMDPTKPFNFSVQGCRGTTFGSNCGPWSVYHYVPAAAPAPPPPVAPPPPPVAPPPPPPPPQTKTCPDGGPTVPVGDACPVKKVAPTNAVTMKVAKAGLLQVNVTVGNTSDLSADCTYDATEANGLGLPVHRDFSLAAKGSTTLTFPAPLLGQSWQLVAACNAPFEGQTVEIGRATGNA